MGMSLSRMATHNVQRCGSSGHTTIEVRLRKKRRAPRSLNPALTAELEGVIGKAMEKDRAKRYQSAAEIRANLQQLKRETESGLTRTGPRATSPIRLATKTFQKTSKRALYLLLGVSALLLTVLVTFGVWWIRHRAGDAGMQSNAVAVLPLQNMTGDSSK